MFYCFFAYTWLLKILFGLLENQPLQKLKIIYYDDDASLFYMSLPPVCGQ